MPTFRFKIGDAFPADDPVARFITVIAMMSNDWLREMTHMVGLKDHHRDSGGQRILSFRQQSAAYYEAAVFIRDSRRRFPAVESFVSGLDADAQEACAMVTGGIDPKSPHYQGEWLAKLRHTTFHYAELQPDKTAHGKEEISEALTAAAEIESTITMDEGFGSVRFDFADEVVVQWVPLEDGPERIERLREAVMALGRFAQQASRAYLESRPEGTFTIED